MSMNDILDILCIVGIVLFIAAIVAVPLMFIVDLIHIWGTIH